MIRRVSAFTITILLSCVSLYLGLTHHTWTLINNDFNAACGSSVTSCTVIMSAPIGAGHALVAIGIFGDATTNLSSITNGGTWAHCANCLIQGNSGGIDLWYNCNASATTPVILNFSAATTGPVAEVLEYSYTGGACGLDTANGALRTTVTNPSGIALTPSSNAVIVQAVNMSSTCSAISGAYTNPADFPGGSGVAGAINQVTGTAPTWTCPSGSGQVMGAAFRENTTSSGCKSSIPLLGVGCK